MSNSGQRGGNTTMLRRLLGCFRILSCLPRIHHEEENEHEEWLLVEVEREVPVTEETLSLLCEHIGSGFEMIGINLGLSAVCVDRCKMSHPSFAMQIFIMLNKWRQFKGRNATVDVLLKALCSSVSTCTIDMLAAMEVLRQM